MGSAKILSILSTLFSVSLSPSPLVDNPVYGYQMYSEGFNVLSRITLSGVHH